MKKLKVYAGSEHPHVAQGLQELPLAAKRRSALTKKVAKKS
jgi:ribosomal protein L13